MKSENDVLRSVLMSKFEINAEEANEIIKDIKVAISEGENPEEILHEYGLEPDWIDELLY